MKAIELAAILLEKANTFERPEEVEIVIESETGRFKSDIKYVRLESGITARLVLKAAEWRIE